MSTVSRAVVPQDRRIWFLLLAGALLAVLASAAWAASAPEPAGRVIRTLGDVEAVAADGSIRRLRRSDPVFEGDTLRTGSSGRAQIRFTDRGLMSLRPETVLAIEDYEFDARAPATGRQQLRLSRGGFRAATGRVADGNRAGYRVSTPLAVIGVRGTLWSASQADGGPLALGVEQGGIEATSASGRTARLGLDAGFDFARINVDGSVDYFVEPPAELATGAGIEEGDEEEGGDGSDGGDEGGDFGAGEEAGQADAPPQTAGAQASSAVAAATSNPENAGAVSQSESGTGSVATEEPIPGIDVPASGLLPAEETALLAADTVAVATSLEGIAVASGIGTVTSDGVPVLAATQAFRAFGPTAGTAPRSELLADAEFLLGSLSGPAEVKADFRGVPGLTWGSFGAPLTIFQRGFDESPSGSSIAIVDALEVNEDVLFAVGLPTDVATLTGSSFYRSTAFDVRTSGLQPVDVLAEANLDFGTGALDGILDVALLLPGSGETADRSFSYVVDFEALVIGGLIRDTDVFDGSFFETTPGSFIGEAVGEPISASISGFVTGGEAEFMQLAFAYSTPARTDAAVSGLVFLDTPRLLSAEQTALSSGFYFVGAFGLAETGVAGGRAVDARLNSGDTLLGFNAASEASGIEPAVPGDGSFLSLPPDFLIRNSGTVSQFVDGVDVAGGDSLAAVVWLGDGDRSSPSGEFAGSGIDVFDAASGAPAFLSFDAIHFITGQPTAIADLTGTFSYSNASLLTSAFYTDTAGAGVPLTGIELFFAVDFLEGVVFDGTLDLFADDTSPVVSLFFDGMVGGEAGVNGADLNIIEGFFGASGFVDPERSELGGFFAGAAGEAFAGAFSIHESGGSGAALGTFVAEQGEFVSISPKALTAAEAALLAEGFGYVEAVCCFDGRTFQGGTIDPRLSLGVDTVLGNGGRNPFESIFNDVAPNDTIIRRDGAVVVNYRDDFSSVGGAELSTFEWQGFGDGTPVGIFNSVTGDLITSIDGNVLVLAGLRSDIAVLTGQRRFELDTLTQGFFIGDTASGGSVPPTPFESADIFFNVDFARAEIFGGVARLFTDVDDIGTDPLGRDRIEASFGGSVALANGNPYVDFDVFSGFSIDGDADAGGDAPLDLTASSMTGFFAGDGSVFNLAFNYTTADASGSEGSFVERVNAVGTAILREADLSLTTAEQSEFDAGFVFVAAECCGPDSSTGAGIAGDPAGAAGDVLVTNGDFLLGLNTDAMGEDLSPLAPGFLDNSPEQIGRRLDATSFVIDDFPVPSEGQLVVGSWFASTGLGSAGAVVDASSGDVFGFLDRSLLFMVGQPSSEAALTSTGFATFAGDSAEVSPIIMDATLGGLLETNIAEVLPDGVLDPDDVLLSSAGLANVSFNADFSSGQILNGALSTTLVGNTTEGFEVGLQLFFDGAMNIGTDYNGFVEVNVRDGSVGGIPLDLEQTDIEIFFIGEGSAGDSSVVAIGSYAGLTQPTADFPDPIAVAGTFSIGSDLLPETRLAPADALALDSGRLGILAYSELSGFFPGSDAFNADSEPAGGLLLGRANAPTGDDFLFGGNALSVQAVNPITGLDLTGVRVRTERRNFFSQPYDFVVRQDTATETLFSDDVVPTGGSSLAGFEVAWGIWNGGPSTPDPVGARIQDAPEDSGLGVIIDRDLFFTSVNPTPQSQMPVTGTFFYSTATSASYGTDFLGVGGGTLLIEGSGADPLASLEVSFDLDFATGDITEGFFSTTYTDSLNTVEWVGGFDGFVNGAVADMEFNNLDILVDGSPNSFGITADLGASDITGVFTGPAGERMVGGFSLIGSDGSSSFEGASAVFILDLVPGGRL